MRQEGFFSAWLIDCDGFSGKVGPTIRGILSKTNISANEMQNFLCRLLTVFVF